MPFKTLRETPAGVDLPGYAFLLRGRFVEERPGRGKWWLPWGMEVLQRLAKAVRGNLVALGGMEVLPRGEGGWSAPWQALATLMEAEIRSYRQLPTLFFTLGEGVQEPAAPRRGLFGGPSAFGTWAFATWRTAEERDRSLARVREEWGSLLTRLGLAGRWVEAAGGIASGEGAAWAFVWAHPAGEREVALCGTCGYAAERAAAVPRWSDAPDEPLKPVQPVATPGATTIADLAAFLQLPPARTLKSVFYTVEGKVLCLVLRGDRAVDEAKVARLLGGQAPRASTEEELAHIGAVAGYASPVGLQGATVWADPSAMQARNLVAGANREGFHLLHVNPGRDFQPDRVVDIARVEEGDPCPHCGAALHLAQAVGLARVEAQERARGFYLDEEGEEVPWAAGAGFLNLEAILGALAEGHRDADGLLWPTDPAPADVYLLTLGGPGAEEVEEAADGLYRRLGEDGWRVIYDDRPERAGVKFKDADLLGVPVRVTLTSRGLKAGGAEVKPRWSQEARLVPVDQVEGYVANLLQERRPKTGDLTLGTGET
ncbi:MAG: proline--tRNA ligase [Anaerolineae bacterium]